MDEIRPARSQEERPTRPGRGGWMGKLALLFSLLALVISCVVLYLVLSKEAEPEYLTYRDQMLLVLEGLDKNTYDPAAFSTDSQGWIHYEKDGKQAAQGVDVSVYQGEIDWQVVADSGIDFAMIRVGYRGYSQGTLQMDERFQANIEGALDAGLDVGVYFFSQATTVAEAEEEADFVLEAIRNYPIQYPVVFDWEYISSQEARTEGMDGQGITQCAAAFCELVSVAGYTPMVYFNQDMGYLVYQLDQLDSSLFWLAEYDSKPDFYYDFDMWQYTHTGTVPGIQGNVDLNLAFRDLSASSQ